MTKIRIFLVEEEPELARLYTRMLERLGHHVAAMVPSGESALELIRELCFDVLLTDAFLPGDVHGIKLATMVKSLLGIPAVIMSNLDKDALTDLDASINDYEHLLKPFSMGQLHSAIVRAHHETKRPNGGST